MSCRVRDLPVFLSDMVLGVAEVAEGGDCKGQVEDWWWLLQPHILETSNSASMPQISQFCQETLQFRSYNSLCSCLVSKPETEFIHNNVVLNIFASITCLPTSNNWSDCYNMRPIISSRIENLCIIWINFIQCFNLKFPSFPFCEIHGIQTPF